MRLPLHLGEVAIAVLTVATLSSTPPASAQKLPWTDANPLARLLGEPAPRKHPVRRHQNARAAPKAPEVGAVPVPDKRPAAKSASATEPAAATPKSPETDKAKPSSAPGVPEAETVPKPQPAPAPPETAAKLPVAAEPVSTPAAKAGAEPSVKKPTDPAATAEKPVDEIPVPVKRPPEPGDAAPAATPAPATEVAPLPVAEQAPIAKPTEADPAPNSTEKLKARIPAVSPAASVLAAAAIEDAENCEAELTRRGVEYSVEDSISEGECGVLRPIRIVKLASGVKVSPKTQMLCRAALALDDWMTLGVLPAAKADLPDRRLTEFRHASTYVCRPRASETGISEHARGSAIDIAAFVFDKGDAIGVEARPAGTPEAKFQDAIRAAACGPFKTVLGPGTDADHATHFHLDIAARNNGATYCK